MSEEVIRTWQDLVQKASPGKMLVAGLTSDGTNVYPQWSEGVAASGQVVAFNGEVFTAVEVTDVLGGSGNFLYSDQDSTLDSGITLTVQGAIAAYPSGAITAQDPTSPQQVATKQYVDDEVQAILSASGGISQATAEGMFVSFASGGVMAAHITQPLTPTASGHLANKAYVDSVTSGSETFVTASSNITLTDEDTVVFVDSTSGPVDVTLPASHTAGRRLRVKDFGSVGAGNTETNLVRIVPQGVTRIEGSMSPLSLTVNQESVTLIGNGAHFGRV